MIVTSNTVNPPKHTTPRPPPLQSNQTAAGNTPRHIARRHRLQKKNAIQMTTTKRKSRSNDRDENKNKKKKKKKKKKKTCTVIETEEEATRVVVKPEKQNGGKNKHVIKAEENNSNGGENFNHRPIPLPNCLCGICFDYKKDSEMFGGSKCQHPFCSDCISKHVAAQIQQNALKVNCPNPNCGVELVPEQLNLILPEEVVVRWESVRCESLIAGLQKNYCPFKDCSVLMVDDGGEIVTSAECPSCHRLFCAQCMVTWHAGMDCEEFKKSGRVKDEEDSERKFLKLAKRKKWQRCPKCSFYVQRRSGCEHMECRCGCNFCYKCGKDWKHGHMCNMFT